MRAMVLRTANVANMFWEWLVAYIVNKYSLLVLFKLPPKHILLLLSNQVVQMFNDIYEYYSNASNMDVSERGAVAVCCAWGILQAQNCIPQVEV
jgi:hypothetical protein